jgi:hypothetical protein
MNRDSDWLRAGRPRGWSSSPDGGKNFHFSMSSIPVLGSTQPPIQWVLGALSPGVKRQGCEADNSPPTNAEVKKMWVSTSTPPYASWRTAKLVKHRDKITSLPYRCHVHWSPLSNPIPSQMYPVCIIP